MNVNITLNLNAVAEIIPDGSLPDFSTLSLQCAKASLYRLSVGEVLRQSIAHHFLDIDLFEYKIRHVTTVDITFNLPSIVMVVMLNGHSIFYDSSKNKLKESYGNCCYLSYVAPGTYKREFLCGTHQILLLTIPAVVLAKHISKFPEIQPILDSYHAESADYLSLSNAPLAKGVFRLLIKANSFTDLSPKAFDKKILQFLLECLGTYNKSMEQNSIQDQLQRDKADEIAQFLLHNYANPIVNSRKKLAAQFCISEATLLRLSQKRFGKSLHQHLIVLRLLYGLKQLMTSDRAVKDVAGSVGYADPYYFSRAFKQEFQISPSEIANLNFGKKDKGLIT